MAPEEYFVVTEYVRSAFKLNASLGEVGKIVPQFHAARGKEADKPVDELGRDAGDATGQEPGSKQDLKEVNRSVGELRDTVAFRYTRK